MLRTLYIIFVAVLLTAFVGVGIAAFYPAPKPPSFVGPIAIPSAPESSQSAQFIKEQQSNATIQNNYMQMSQKYSRDVSIIALGAAIIILVLSLTLIKNILIMADGAMLGGVLTLIYSLIRGFTSEDEMFRFIVVTLGLIIAITLGYIKFIKPAPVHRKRK